MTEVQAPAEPKVLEFGRYRLFEAPDGGWIVARAVETCERCQNCGCGEQAEPIAVPGMIIKLAGQRGALAKFKAMTGRG